MARTLDSSRCINNQHGFIAFDYFPHSVAQHTLSVHGIIRSVQLEIFGFVIARWSGRVRRYALFHRCFKRHLGTSSTEIQSTQWFYRIEKYAQLNDYELQSFIYQVLWLGLEHLAQLYPSKRWLIPSHSQLLLTRTEFGRQSSETGILNGSAGSWLLRVELWHRLGCSCCFNPLNSWNISRQCEEDTWANVGRQWQRSI